MTSPASLTDIIQRRRTVRRFQPTPVPRSVVEGLLELAVQAPSAHNSQPWRFVVLYEEKTRRDMALAMADALRERRLGDGDAPGDVEADAARSIERITGAPVALLLCMSESDLDRYPDAARTRAEHHLAIQSTALAAGHLLLAAEEAGLGAFWLCAPMFAQDVVCDMLGLPDCWAPQALILLGHPDENSSPRSRKDMKEVVQWR